MRCDLHIEDGDEHVPETGGSVGKYRRISLDPLLKTIVFLTFCLISPVDHTSELEDPPV